MHSQVQQAPRLPVLIVLSALAVLPINMFVPSLPSIARDFNAEFVLVNVAVTGYAVATAVTHLIAGALSDRFGRKPIALAALAIFAMASIGCSSAGDIRTAKGWFSRESLLWVDKEHSPVSGCGCGRLMK